MFGMKRIAAVIVIILFLVPFFYHFSGILKKTLTREKRLFLANSSS